MRSPSSPRRSIGVPGRQNQGARLLAAVRREPGITYAGLGQALNLTQKRVGELVRLYAQVGLLVIQRTRGTICVRPGGAVVVSGGERGI